MKKTKKIFALISVLFISSAIFAQSEDYESTEKALNSLGNIIKDAGKIISSEVKESLDKASEAIEGKSLIKATGVLKMNVLTKQFTFKSDDGNSYKVKTVSQSLDSIAKLSGYKNKRIDITGLLDSKTNELTLTTYSLAKEE